MANPQKENGFVSIATELVEAFARSEFTQNESKILWVILRKTYGWNKKTDHISLSEMARLAEMPQWSVQRAVKGLVAKNIITKEKVKNLAAVYGIQKNHQKWTTGRHGFVLHETAQAVGTKSSNQPYTPHAEIPPTGSCPSIDNKDKNRQLSRARARGKADWMVEKELVEAAKTEIPNLKKLGWDDQKIKEHLIQARGFSEKQADEAMGKQF